VGRGFVKKKFVPFSVLVLAVSVSALIRLFLIIQEQFDGLYGQDPYAYYTYATGALRDSILVFAGPPHFLWPPGYPYLVAAVSFATGLTPAAGQLVSLVTSLLVPIFTYLLARELWPSKTGRYWGPALAGLLVTFQGQLWQSSVVVMADAAGLAAATGGVWALARYARPDRSAGWLWLAAAALAWAVLTRWAYALVAIPVTLYALYTLWQRPRKTALLHATGAAVVTLLVLAPLFAPVLAFLSGPAGDDPSFVVDLQVYRWNPLNALRRSFFTADGLLQYRLPNGPYYLTAPAHRFFFTPLLAGLLVPSLWVSWRKRTVSLLLLLWGWAGVVFLFHAGAPWQNFRFTLAYLPPLAILVAMGAMQVWLWLGHPRLGESVRRVARPVFAGALIAGLLWMAWGGWTLTNQFIERKQDNLALISWVEGQAEDETRLLTFNLTLAFQQYSDLDTRELFYESPQSLAELATSDVPILLLVDVENVASQWADKAPGENYRWLRDSLGLSVIGKRGPYTLFTVRTLGPAGEG
jgi:4-amino-4-deoxy-L-arabinose transferase-like glycosyltransferase